MKVIWRNKSNNETVLKLDQEYIVYSITYLKESGFHIYLKTEKNALPKFFDAKGFEFTSKKMPSSWVTFFNESNNKGTITLLPKSWNYEGFFEDIANGNEKALELFNEEARKISDFEQTD